MSHTSNAPKPAPPAPITPEAAYRMGVASAKQNIHPSYDAAEKEFLTANGDRQLKGFEQGYYDGSTGYA